VLLALSITACAKAKINGNANNASLTPPHVLTKPEYFLGGDRGEGVKQWCLIKFSASNNIRFTPLGQPDVAQKQYFGYPQQ